MAFIDIALCKSAKPKNSVISYIRLLKYGIIYASILSVGLHLFSGCGQGFKIDIYIGEERLIGPLRCDGPPLF